MILRKPYALLIKYFRVIHIILSLLGAYVFYNINRMYPYLQNYIKTPSTLKGFDVSKELFPGLLYFSIIVLLISSLFLLALMIFKKKPYIYYLISSGSYIYLLVVLNISHEYINTMENALVDVLKIRVAGDFVAIALILQALNVGYAFLRATGFNLKKFDFGEDLDELEISEEDREEFEVQLEFDYNVYVTRTRRLIRNLKYYYVENRFYSNIAIIVSVVVITILSFTNVYIFNKTYKENNLLATNDFRVKVLDSYVTQKDYRNDRFLSDTKLVVVKISIQSFKEKKYLNSDAYYLVVNNKRYNMVSGYAEKVIDLGRNYNNQLLLEDFTNYLLVFEVPNDTKLDKAEIIFKDYMIAGSGLLAKTIHVKLNTELLDKEIITKKYELGEEIALVDTILKAGTLKINKVSIDDTLELTYNFCANKTNCYDSTEILNPILDSYEKEILSLEGTISNMTMNKFIVRYGKLVFTKSNTNTFELLEPKKAKSLVNNYYQIKKTEDTLTSLVFDIRNYHLEYVITTNNL